MKKLLPFLSLALFTAAACNTAPQIADKTSPVEPSAITAPAQDTSGMAEFKAWKAQNELASMAAYQGEAQPVAASKPAVKRSVASSSVKKASKPVKKATAPSQNTSSSGNTASSGNEGVGSTGAGTQETAKVEKKEGWSKSAKGAVIGGVVGAAGGAVINKKNRVLGAVIGGVVGAAGGYGIGRGMDKKDGRIEMNP